MLFTNKCYTLRCSSLYGGSTIDKFGQLFSSTMLGHGEDAMNAVANDLVVVRIAPEFRVSDSGNRWACRVNQLGLVAYGVSPESSLGSLKMLFKKFINAHRDAGTLKDVLGNSGLSWAPATDWDGDYEVAGTASARSVGSPRRYRKLPQTIELNQAA